MANANITNSEDRLDRTIRQFENSMHHLAEHLGETREAVDEKVQRAKGVIEIPRRLAFRARFQFERHPFPFMGVVFGIGLLLGMKWASVAEED